MRLPHAQELALTSDEAVAQIVAEAPDGPAVFVLWPHEGAPHLGRTSKLRRRLARLLHPSSRLSLRRVVARLSYWPTGSSLESMLVLYALTRRLHPDDYRVRLRLRMPHYLEVIRNHAFPRTTITTHLTKGDRLWFGPFRTRAGAEAFEGEFLSLFQLRRCREDFTPSPDHPGCAYGEMQLCLRPCQAVVDAAGYRAAVRRATEFLGTNGESLLVTLDAARDAASESLDFESAARLHRQIEKAKGVLALQEELAREITSLHGIGVVPAVEGGHATLIPVAAGVWQTPRDVTADAPLQESLWPAWVEAEDEAAREDGLALLTRWHSSTWREGEWISVSDWARLPRRRLLNAIRRVAKPTTDTSHPTLLAER